MFEKLYARPQTIEKYRAAPLVQERVRYIQHRAGSGSRPNSLRKLATAQLRLVQILDLRHGEKITVARVELAAKAWARLGTHWYGRPASPQATKWFANQVLGWLRFLGWLEEPEQVQHTHAGELTAYAAWMQTERGLSYDTIRNNLRGAAMFFRWLAANDIALASLTIKDIDRAIAAKRDAGNYSRRTVTLYAQRIRSFIAYAERMDWCGAGMAAGIMAPKSYPDEDVPRGLSRKDVDRLLASTEGDRPCDKRARAILMLLIGYGLRAGEVAGLQLDDLDWENETIRVRRPKTGRTDLYPLSRGVAQAILRYIREVRPSRSERNIFFTVNAPIKPLRPTAVSGVVRNRVVSLGIVARHRGAHALRHSAAQHLLDQGMSMKVIGDFLGHRSPSSTAVYAKVNLNALREVADVDLGGLA